MPLVGIVSPDAAGTGRRLLRNAARVTMLALVSPAASTGGWAAFDQDPAALVLTDPELGVVRANRAFFELLDVPDPRNPGFDCYSIMRSADLEPARERIAQLHADGIPFAVEQSFRRQDGGELWLRVHASVVDMSEGERLLMARLEDMTDQRRTTVRLRRLAERDHLTGLLNRRRLEEELEVSLASLRRHDRKAALIVIDLDHFKAVNDRDGHEAGDRTLAFIAATLATRVREEDAVARLGGDEFAVLLRDTSLEAAEQVAAELVSIVGGAAYAQERGVTLSAGVAALTLQQRSAQDALHAADLAMYAAKEAGRDRVASHPPVNGAEGTGLLGRLGAVAESPSVEHALRAVRELLGMDVSYVTRHTHDEQVLLATEGDAASFGLAPGTRIPLAETLCAHILDGDLPRVMPDVGLVPRAAKLAITTAARLGAYVSVPIMLSDGSLFGTLCAANHRPVEGLGERDVQFLTVLARMVAGDVERDTALRAQLSLRIEAAGTEALLSAIEARDRYTGAHSREVVELATEVARELGLPESGEREVAQVALLHDIGKLALPDAILTKPGPLTRDEIVVMRRHPEDGERIVAAIDELSHLAPAIRAEHERWDGFGYPDGLVGDAIPIASRIVFVCDAWDAMTSDRPYRVRLPRDEAVAELAGGAGSQFCRDSVDALFRVLARR